MAWIIAGLIVLFCFWIGLKVWLFYRLKPKKPWVYGQGVYPPAPPRHLPGNWQHKEVRKELDYRGIGSIKKFARSSIVNNSGSWFDMPGGVPRALSFQHLLRNAGISIREPDANNLPFEV
jgi:hypothetical protein